MPAAMLVFYVAVAALMVSSYPVPLTGLVALLVTLRLLGRRQVVQIDWSKEKESTRDRLFRPASLPGLLGGRLLSSWKRGVTWSTSRFVRRKLMAVDGQGLVANHRSPLGHYSLAQSPRQAL
jgi:hypothetical protein